MTSGHGRSAAVVDSSPAVDLLIVTFHGGSEGAKAMRTGEAAESLGRSTGRSSPMGPAVIDAGADAVIGHGPHVLRGMEFYRGRLIAYSLGNFLTYRGFNLEGQSGSPAVATRVRRIARSAARDWCPWCSFPDGVPHPTPTARPSSWFGLFRRRTSAPRQRTSRLRAISRHRNRETQPPCPAAGARLLIRHDAYRTGARRG